MGLVGGSFAQDSINVTFRYKPDGAVVRVFVPGEFNNWGPNSSGRISPTAPSLMVDEDGTWFKTIRLRVGGGSLNIGGEQVYQYKMHEHLNSDGSSYNWLSDPLNPNRNAADNNNSYFAVKHPLIFQVEPRPAQTVRNDQPAIRATVAARNTDSIDVDQSSIRINGNLAGSFGHYYDRDKQWLNIPSLTAFGLSLEPGSNTITITAVTKSGVIRSDSVIVNYLENPPLVNEPVPEGIIEGINYYVDDDTRVTLCLFAPYKKFVYVMGDFNNWLPDPGYFMNRDSTAPDTIRWWLTLSDLTPQQEYAFQYFIDDEIRIADPYTEKILDPWNDQYITSATYPDLKPYPTGKTEHAVSILQTARETYEWQIEDFQRPPAKDLIIYELLVRDFVAAHDFKTLIDTLDYLQNLGINAIELMPINEFEGNESWGYNPSFYFAVDKYYGPADDFKRFVDACHERGIAVIIDMVLNHSYNQSPFVRLYNEGDYGKPLPENPWYNVESPNPVYSWGSDFDHESPVTKKLIDRINQFWLTEYKVDGFRFDFTKGFTNKPGDGGAFDGTRINILKRMADKIWEVSADAYVILEHFADNTEEKILSDYGMLLWGNSNFNYNEATMGYHDGGKSDFSWGYFKSRGWDKAGLVTYMESHDEERLMYKNLQYGNVSGDYSIKNLYTALNRIKLAAAFFLTLPGPKMIWQFGEIGYDYSIDYNGRVGNKPIRWDYLQDNDRRNLYKTFAWLLKMRRENEAFRSEFSSVNLNVSGAGKRINISHGTLNATIIGNFGVTTLSIAPNFQHTGNWYDYFSGDTLVVTSTNELITLEPGRFHIYTNKKLETPDEDVLSDIEESISILPQEFALLQNYPNPFNPTTTINYKLAALSQVDLSIYNLLGQKVATLVSAKQAPGNYEVRWDATGMSSGVYIYRLSTEQGFSETRKLVLLR